MRATYSRAARRSCCNSKHRSKPSSPRRGGDGNWERMSFSIRAASAPLPHELLEAVDILTPNETEAAILAGFAPRPLNPGEAAAIALKLQGMGPRTIIVNPSLAARAAGIFGTRGQPFGTLESRAPEKRRAG